MFRYDTRLTWSACAPQCISRLSAAAGTELQSVGRDSACNNTHAAHSVPYFNWVPLLSCRSLALQQYDEAKKGQQQAVAVSSSRLTRAAAATTTAKPAAAETRADADWDLCGWQDEPSVVSVLSGDSLSSRAGMRMHGQHNSNCLAGTARQCMMHGCYLAAVMLQRVHKHQQLLVSTA